MIIPLLYNDFVQNNHLFTPESYGNLLSISQITPGAVSINTATYVGFIKAGLIGAIVSTIGLCFPTFILTSVFLNFLYKHKDKPLVIGFFKGTKWAALIMILFAIGLFAKISVLDIPSDIKNININWFELFIMFVSIILIYKKLPFTILLLISAILGFSIGYS